MDRARTRREFVRTLAVGGSMSGLAAASGAARGWGDRAAGQEPRQREIASERSAVKPQSITKENIELEIRRRADVQLQQQRLVVDYYRIRRKMAYPLPLKSLLVPDVPVPGIPAYPWSTWLLWTLEERIHCLGWAAEWLGDETARKAATADLEALAQWPEYGQSGGPTLSSAHAGRILWTAATCWQWVNEDLQRSIRDACRRHAQSVLLGADKFFASVRSKQDVLRTDPPHSLLHNIRIIGTAGAALTASVAQHPAAAILNACLKGLFGALLDLRAEGLGEGVAYDGYVLDFIADWLSGLPEEARRTLLDDPHMDEYLDQSYMLAAPGAAEQAAELSDVEPQEMPFHLSAQAKLLRLRPHPVRAWHIARCPLDCLRIDALAALRRLDRAPAGEPPPAGALDAHYAAVLRSGWEEQDLAVAVARSNSPMGHIHHDNGTLVIGKRGAWIITDPGYQQYMRGDEREFTVGPAAHNAPLINDAAQTRKQSRQIVLEDVGANVYHVALDLAACYASSLSLKRLVRHVWLSGDNLVVVADQMEAEAPPRATYHWHGHSAAAWWVEANWALVALGRTQLWFTSPQAQLSGANLLRLPGARGQLTLQCAIESAGPVVWWVFAFDRERPVLDMDSGGRRIRLWRQTFSL